MPGNELSKRFTTLVREIFGALETRGLRGWAHNVNHAPYQDPRSIYPSSVFGLGGQSSCYGFGYGVRGAVKLHGAGVCGNEEVNSETCGLEHETFASFG